MSLESLRAELSHLNKEILGLLNQRAHLVLAVAEEKRRLGLPTHDPTREQTMLDEVASDNEGPFSNDAVEQVFTTILRISRDLMDE